jgi:probable F420-dependent oxidoreductase
VNQESLLFGLNLPTSATPGSDPVADARRAEELGFDFVSASDHPCGANPSYETWTMLSWVAAATTRIRIATRVLGVPYRNPALVAKMAETFDRLSGGRLILGLGGGSSDHEFRAFGMLVPGPRDKIDGLGEAVEIIRGLWSQPGFTYPGRLHRTDQADVEPKPSHRIPIWLGTFGERSLALTGRLADGWIPSLGYAPPDLVPAMRDRVLAAAREAGRSPEDITCAYNIEVRVGEDAEPEEHVVSGRPAEVAARLNDFRKMGFSAMNFMLSGPDTTEQAERLAREVIPELRAMA